MMVRRTGVMFGCALGASLAVHAGLFLWIDRALDDRYRLQEADRVEAVMIALPPKLQLGLEQASKPSPTWLGFEEYQEQFAEMSPTEQAAFADETPVPSQDGQEPVIPAIDVNKLTEAVDQVSSEVAKTAAEVAKQLERIRSLMESSMAVKGSPLAVEEVSEAAAALTVEAPKTESQTEPSPAQAPPAARSNEQVGSLADKQSLPTSIIDIPPDQWKLGKPLASQGLELKPRRPTLTVLTMLTAAPGNPLCVIYFNHEGVAVKAAVLRSSGDQRVDSAILASLYRWRALGKALDEVKDDHPLEVTVRILLTRQRVDQEA
jgi:hypothetical protein